MCLKATARYETDNVRAVIEIAMTIILQAIECRPMSCSHYSAAEKAAISLLSSRG